MPAVPDTLLEPGAGPTLLTPAASHAQKPPEGTDWCRVGFGCGQVTKTCHGTIDIRAMCASCVSCRDLSDTGQLSGMTLDTVEA